MTAVCIVAEFSGPKRCISMSADSTNSVLFLHSNMQKWQLNSDLVNSDIHKVFLGNKRFTTLDVFQLFSCLSTKLYYFKISCYILHLFLRDIRTENGNWVMRMGISHNVGNGNWSKYTTDKKPYFCNCDPRPDPTHQKVVNFDPTQPNLQVGPTHGQLCPVLVSYTGTKL